MRLQQALIVMTDLSDSSDILASGGAGSQRSQVVGSGEQVLFDFRVKMHSKQPAR